MDSLRKAPAKEIVREGHQAGTARIARFTVAKCGRRMSLPPLLDGESQVPLGIAIAAGGFSIRELVFPGRDDGAPGLLSRYRRRVELGS